MSALVCLNPTLQETLSKEHGVTISGFYETSFVIKFDGIPSAVRAARKVINDLLSNATITNVQFVFSHSLLLITQKQLEAEQCKAYSVISNSDLQMSADKLTVTVCSFDERHHSMAITLLDRKDPMIEEISIPPLTISNDDLIQQLKQLEDDFCVLIQQEIRDINEHSRQNLIEITGYCPSRVKNAQSSVISLLKLYSEQQVKLECKPEEVIYLCKVDKESRSILSSLPVKVSTQGGEIMITGNHDCIVQSKKLVFSGPLLHLQFKSYTFKCKSIFLSPIKHYILEPFAAEYGIQYYIDKSENNSHIDGDVSIDPEIEGFRIIIYSKNEYVFTQVCCEMEAINPKTQLFQPYCEEAIHFVRKTKKWFEDKYRVCVIIDDSIRTCEVTVYGLTLDEVQQCWKHIDDDIGSNVETTKQVPLNRHERMYLENKQADKLKQSFSCELTFPQHKESEKDFVYIQGKIKDVKPVESRLADLQGKIQIINFNVQCKSVLMKMWRMWWHDLIIQQQEKHEVIIQFDDDLKGSAKHGRSIIQVAFEIIGTNVDVLRCIESILRDEETEERVINNLKGNKSAFVDVKKLPLFNMFPIAIIGTNQWSGTITIVSPMSLSSNLDIAEEEILKFFELHADISKEITFEDPIFRLILASPTMSSHYFETIKDIAEPEKVVVHVSKQAKLKLTGNPSAVEKVESLIHMQFINEIESIFYSVSSNHATLLATNKFLHFESELQNEYCVTLSYTKPKCSSKVLHTKGIKSPSRFAHCLQLSICYGSIVYEEVDAVVNLANEDLKHVSGIAKSIVAGGGAIIQYESDEYIQQNGKVATGTCICLGAGELPSNKIIHAVWPECHEECKEE